MDVGGSTKMFNNERNREQNETASTNGIFVLTCLRPNSNANVKVEINSFEKYLAILLVLCKVNHSKPTKRGCWKRDFLGNGSEDQKTSLG
jgi:hypothetical protein